MSFNKDYNKSDAHVSVKEMKNLKILRQNINMNIQN